ncbi:MAG: DUF4388 domain-containing protein [Nannocystaceae bacterium]|nr:DUF4388 domain-containing protein [Myxococcales bacterium]
MGAQIHVLQFLSGKYRGKEFPLGPDQVNFIVGRSSDVDLVLGDDAVSRRHARIFLERGRTWMHDLGSRNGTIVNGAPARKHCLREGDRLVIGASLIGVALADASKVSKGWAGERGEPAESESSSRSMSGSLTDIPLVDVLQWLAASRKTGTLNVRNSDLASTGRIYLRDGQAFYASINNNAAMDPEKALIRMLGWVTGTFGLDSSTLEEAPRKEIATSLGHVLMEAARLNDEIEHLAERAKIPRYSTPVHLVRPGPRWRDLKAEDLDLVQDLAEGRSWSEIMDTYEEDDLSLIRRALDLKKRGVLDYEG